MSYNAYSGKFYEEHFARGYNATIEADFEKSMISLGLYPLNLYFLNRLDLNLGNEISRLVHEKFTGTEETNYLRIPGGIEHNIYDLNDILNNFSSPWALGLQTRLTYDIFLTKSLILAPQVSFYIGLSNEFGEIYSDVKLMRLNFCIGVEKKFITE